MRSMPFIAAILTLFLSGWIGVGSTYVEVVNELTREANSVAQISELQQLDSCFPNSEGTSNKVGKTGPQSSVTLGKISCLSALPFISKSPFEVFASLSSVLSSNISAVFSNSIHDAFHRVYLHLHFCIWRN